MQPATEPVLTNKQPDNLLAGRLTLDEKFAICRAVAQECIQDSELRNLLDKKPSIAAYDGFEPSGRMHIAQVSGPTCSTLAHARSQCC